MISYYQKENISVADFQQDGMLRSLVFAGKYERMTPDEYKRCRGFSDILFFFLAARMGQCMNTSQRSLVGGWVFGRVQQMRKPLAIMPPPA